MENSAGNNPPGMLVTSSNFHSIPSLSVSLVNPLFESFGGYQWKSMDRLWRASNPYALEVVLNQTFHKALLRPKSHFYRVDNLRGI